jgi:conjugal transfer pilus assembly protein TraB
MAAGGIGAVLLLAMAASRERRSPAPPEPRRESFEVGLPTAQEVRAMVGAYGQRVEETERGLGELRTELTRTRSSIEEALKGLAAPSAQPQEPPAPATPRFRSLAFTGGGRGRTVHIPAGSFGEATLLSGVFAPTGGEPLPVLLRLDAALIGPNRTRLRLRDALLVGKAVGDANSRRATVQIDTLSLATPSGRVHEAKVNGWLVDDDGLQGLRGTYVWRADEIVALATATGALSAGADALAARELTTTVNPLGGVTSAVTGDAAQLAGYRALGGAASRLSEVIADRLKEIVPAIHVTNGKKVTVAFVNGVTIDGLETEEVRDAAGADPHRGLGLDR